MIGQFLLSLDPAAEDRILTTTMRPSEYFNTGTHGPCLIGRALDLKRDDASNMRLGLWKQEQYGRCPTGWVRTPIESRYDRACIKFGVSRVNAAIRDLGYVWRLGRLHLPLPLGLLMGTAYVEERPDPDDADRFTMRMVLRHRWFGDVFRYSGRFRLGSQ